MAAGEPQVCTHRGRERGRRDGGEKQGLRGKGETPADPGRDSIDAEREAEESCIYLRSFPWCPGRRLPASRLPRAPLEPTGPARSVLVFSLLVFFF